MDRFKKVYLTVYAATASLSWYILEKILAQRNIEDLLTPLLTYLNLPVEYSSSFAIPIIVFFLVLLFRMGDFISRTIIEKIPFFSRNLRRILKGHTDIEGDWPLVVIDIENRKPLYLGFLAIHFKDGNHFVYGDDWHLDGNHAHSFHSIQSLNRDYKLQYWYEQGASMHNPDMRGYTEIFFFPKYKFAKRHAGKFLDPEHLTDIRFYAERQKYPIFGSRLKTKEQKLEAARAVWSRLEPRIEYLHERDIDADFI